MANKINIREAMNAAWFKVIRAQTKKDVTVTFAEEVVRNDAPRPPRPYITLKLISGPTPFQSFDELRDIPGPDNMFEITGMRQFTLSIQAFGVGAHDILEDIQTLLDSPLVRESLRSLGDIAIVNKGAVEDITAELETGFERRANLDVIFNTSKTKTVDPSSIEKVSVGGELFNTESESRVISDFEVEKP